LNCPKSLEAYFIQTNFHDLMPLAIQISKELGYNQDEMAGAIVMCSYN